MFKLGDKVTSLMNGKGIVEAIDSEATYPICVIYDDGYSDSYRRDGKIYEKDNIPSLYHGHGTFKIEFVEDKEPEYEWQWLVLSDEGYYETTFYFKNEEQLRSGCKTDKIIYRIEESKREVKHG